MHIVVIAVSVTMVLLGRWQWRVAHVHHGSVQNYAYAFQWWAFTAFVLFMWARVLRDQIRRRPAVAAKPVAEPAPPAEYRRYVMPTSQDAPPISDDPELAAYNDYLAGLAESDRTRKDAR